MTSSVLAVCFFFAVFTIVYAAPADEKAFDCPANEKYYKCEHEVCYKTCDHLKHPPACASIAADCYKPGCLCTGDDLRNSEGKCVPMAQCDAPTIL